MLIRTRHRHIRLILWIGLFLLVATSFGKFYFKVFHKRESHHSMIIPVKFVRRVSRVGV